MNHFPRWGEKFADAAKHWFFQCSVLLTLNPFQMHHIGSYDDQTG